MPVRLAALLVLLLSLLAAPVRADGGTGPVVFAAASLKTALDEIATAWEAETGRRLVVSLAGSSALARQVQAGAPAEVFMSASPDWMYLLQRDGLLAPGTRVDLLGNRLVLIGHGAAAPAPIGPELDLVARLDGGRLAMALVQAVPAGIYGKAALEHLGLWEQAAPHVAQADNVRAALAFVASGEAPLGVVYATDAAATGAVSVIGTFPEGSHPPIVYPAAAIGPEPSAVALAFLAFLQDAPARAAFERQGFRVLVP